MKKIKKIIKKLIGNKNIFYINQARFLYNKVNKKKYGKIGIIKSLLDVKIYFDKLSKGKSIKELLNNVKVEKISNQERFYYYIDYNKKNYIKNEMIGNLTIDYSFVLNNSLNDIKNFLKQNRKVDEFYNEEIYVLNGIENLIEKITNKLKKQNMNQMIVENLNNIKDKKCSSFYEALQRILFFNQQLWQTQHTLMGLGRLDMILFEYYENDIKNGVLSSNDAKVLLKDFLKCLHKFFDMKSNMLLGDTGQIIILGGIDVEGNYYCNELTYLFIEIIKELQIPDPKILLRVSRNMPRKLMEKSLKCIQTGVGSPLFANDDVIIEKLINFGYSKEDSYNYATSACWEPYIIGKAFDQNNMKSISFAKPFELLLENEELAKIKHFDELIELYKKYLKKYLEDIIDDINRIRFEKDPIVSLFFNECVKSNKDISEGGAIYNDIGLTSVGLSNLINSFINIYEIVFVNKSRSLEEFYKIVENNFDGNDVFRKSLKENKLKYGVDNEFVIKLSNEIIKYTSEILLSKTNNWGGKFKFGLSSPAYITDSKESLASFDGRKNGEPFNVHISSDRLNAYTELIQFASKLDYGENRFNGNVVDFFVSPNFIEDNFEKFVDFLMLSIKAGYFEMQMNVVSSDTLIKARKEPEKFPNLIVRVWGFSAYFNELPDEYKDYLIERALSSENNN